MVIIKKVCLYFISIGYISLYSMNQPSINLERLYQYLTLIQNSSLQNYLNQIALQNHLSRLQKLDEQVDALLELSNKSHLNFPDLEVLATIIKGLRHLTTNNSRTQEFLPRATSTDVLEQTAQDLCTKIVLANPDKLLQTIQSAIIQEQKKMHELLASAPSPNTLQTLNTAQVLQLQPKADALIRHRETLDLLQEHKQDILLQQSLTNLPLPHRPPINPLRLICSRSSSHSSSQSNNSTVSPDPFTPHSSPEPKIPGWDTPSPLNIQSPYQDSSEQKRTIEPSFQAPASIPLTTQSIASSYMLPAPTSLTVPKKRLTYKKFDLTKCRIAECSQTFEGSSIKELVEGKLFPHLIAYHYQCPYCSHQDKDKNIQKLNEHIDKEHMAKKAFLCTLCDDKEPSNNNVSQLIAHYGRHSQKRLEYNDPQTKKFRKKSKAKTDHSRLYNSSYSISSVMPSSSSELQSHNIPVTLRGQKRSNATLDLQNYKQSYKRFCTETLAINTSQLSSSIAIAPLEPPIKPVSREPSPNPNGSPTFIFNFTTNNFGTQINAQTNTKITQGSLDDLPLSEFNLISPPGITPPPSLSPLVRTPSPPKEGNSK